MAVLHRQDWSGGWQPSADLFNGPSNGYARGDNLVMDDQGALRVRRDIECVSGATPLVTNGSVHSLFTVTLDGIRHRYAGIDNGVWRSETVGFYSQILSNFTGSGDISFGSTLGMVMMARGTTKFKNDGSSSYQWGLQQPPNAPSLSAIDPDEKTFSSFDNGESPSWAAIEGTIAAVSGYDDTPNGARLVNPATTTGKATIRKIFGSVQDFTAYDGGDTGVDEDNIEFYVWIQQPSNLEYLTLSIDVNGDSNLDSARFRDDYYYVTITEAVDLKLDPEEALDDRYDAVGFEREDFLFRKREFQNTQGARVRRDTAQTSGSGWAKFSIPRGKFIRVGSTPGKNWSTVKALQLDFKTTIGAGITPGACRFDNMRIIGGQHHALTGKYKAAVQLIANFPKYEAKSPLSPLSDEIELRSNGLQVNFTLPAGFDGQITGAVVFLMGGTMDGFYEAKRRNIAIGPGSNTYNINVDLSDADILIRNVRLDPSIQNPPDNIIGIAGPFDGRMMALTQESVFPSLPGDIDAYSSEQELPLPGKSATGWWIASVNQEPFVGTSLGILRIIGNGGILQDGTIDYGFRNVDVPPPISSAIAQDGNLLIYLAADGWRAFNGVTSVPIVSNLDLLYQGYTRYGIPPPNLGSDPGRYSAGIFNNRIFALIPENSTNSTNIMHVHNLRTQQWESRYVLPRSMQKVYREPDGKMLLGDSSGSIYQLEAGSGQGDLIPSGGALIRQKKPIVLWTFAEDNGEPLALRTIEEARCDADTFGDNLGMNFCYDGGGPLFGFDINDTTNGSLLDAAQEFTHVQVRFQGSFSDLVLRNFSIFYRPQPVSRLRWDSGPINFGVQDLVWISKIRIMARIRSAITMRLTFDGDEAGVITDTFSAPSYPAQTDFEVTLGREVFGAVPRIVLHTAALLTNTNQGFDPYWVEIWWRPSGRQTLEKKMIRILQQDAK